jgi:DNA-binding MarR family transcriptional regulator
MTVSSELKPMNCACFNVRKTARVLTQEYDQSLVDCGLKTTQFSALAVINRLGPIKITALAKAMEIERTSLTRNLGLLQRDGLVLVRPGEDARSRLVELTRLGREKFDEAIGLWETTQARVLDKFGKKRFETLRRELEELREVVQSTR